jgi:hypothetical protein
MRLFILKVRAARILKTSLASGVVIGLATIASPSNAQTPQQSAPSTSRTVSWSSYDANIGDLTIKLPIPPGYTEPSSDIPAFRSMGEKLTAKTNRLLAFYVSLPDFRTAAVGGEPALARYFMVQTLRAMESTPFDSTMLEVTKTMLKSQAGSIFKRAEAESQTTLDAYAKSIGDGQAKIKLGEVTSLGIFDDQPNSMTLLGLTKLQVVRDGGQTELTILFATNFLRIKDRVVYYYAYTRYEGKEDIEWAAQASKAWVTQALLMNQ